MSYLAFALKYRPQKFSEVIGQEHVVASLENAIRSNRVHHAYLFSGPRGVGKTSLARILAKSLNCFKGPAVTACGECPSCREISRGQSLDIIEIDGASNRGIDEIRTLRENVKLSAANSRYKIYIVDEVHMLTQEAFNALLKTLEEPPAHVKFIFATTHPHKVPPTILSRCQKFQFNLIALEKIVAKLKKIAAAEKLKIKDSLLYTIGRAAGGSIRDAESLLDQLAPIILEKGSLEDVFSFLGIIDESSLNYFLKALVDRDLSASLAFVERTVQDGKDLSIFLNAFIEHLRNLLLSKVSLKSFKELSDISPESKDFICGLAKEVSVHDTLELIDLLIEARRLSSSLNTVRIPLELALIKYLKPEENNPSRVNLRKDKQENSKNNPVDNPAEKNQDNPGPEADQDDFNLKIEDIDLEEEEETPAVRPVEKEPAEEVFQDNSILPQLKSRWKEIIAVMQRKRAALASHLSFARPISSGGSRATIAFSPRDSFHKETVESSKNLQFIEEIISRLINKKVGVKFIFKELPPGESPPDLPDSEENGGEAKASRKEDEAKPGKVSDDTFLNELLDTFGGRFHSDE